MASTLRFFTLSRIWNPRGEAHGADIPRGLIFDEQSASSQVTMEYSVGRNCWIPELCQA